ncbi:MAG: tyrosine-type recombinase/integrase [Methylocystis sp.]|uniref:tyrosine-type recombinase/integrase n=1 Tax=Methylocystis sp. TaxID=1911079 RepID=UPI003DA5F9CE
MHQEPDSSQKQRKAKTELDSRSFRDGQIYLYRRADYKKPTWFCRVKVPGAKGYISQSTKTTDEHAAYKVADDLFLSCLARVASGQDIASKRVSVAIKEYVREASLLGEPSFSRKLQLQFLKRTDSFFGTMSLKDVTTATLLDLNLWLHQRSRNGRLSPTSIKRYSMDLKQFLGWCVERSYIDRIPTFPKIKSENNRRPHFDRNDWAKLTGHLCAFTNGHPWVARDRTMLANYVLILAETGIRVGEARQLKWRDVRELPTSRQSDRPADVVLYVTGKTGPREVVAATADVKTYFRRIFELRSEELERAPSADDFIFCNRDGSPIASFKKSFAALLKSAGVETDSHGNKRTIYSLRHTYATFRLEEGVHQFILARNMGTSVEMLEKHYGHTSNVASAEELTKGRWSSREGAAQGLAWLIGDESA